MSDGLLIGVDLGGTKVECMAALRRDDDLDVVVRRRVATKRERGYEAVLQTTADLVREVCAEVGADIHHVPVGVGMPGGVTRREGLVKNANTVCLNGRPFRADLERALGRSVVFENDASCFALAETWLGAAKEYREGVVFGVILGTGVGGGLVLHGSLWSGAQGIAGEWGHHAATADRERPCYCGKQGCLEQYASGPAVEADYERRSGERRSLEEIALRRHNDEAAAEAIEGLLEAFGRGLANVIDIMDPSAIVLGGGVSNLECLYEEGRERVAKFVFNDELTTPILKHALGDSAGVFGAAWLASMR